MPTNRTYRRRHQRQPMTRVEAALLRDDPPPPGSDAELVSLRYFNRNRLAELWAEHGAEIAAEFAAERPGTRPSWWWKIDAPRSPIGTYAGAFFDGTLPEPRRRLGGTGRPIWEALPAYVPEFRLGVPAMFADDFDPDDPPIYEAQASYLERHALLLPGERARLRKHDFAPVAVELVEDEDEDDDLVDEPDA